MRKRFAFLQIAVLLVFLGSSLDSSISSSKLLQYTNSSSTGILTNSLTIEAFMEETVIIDNNGDCQLSIVMDTNSTELDLIYSNSLGFNEATPYIDQIVPENFSMDGTYDLANYVDPSVTVNTASPLEVLGDIPVNSSFCDGIYQQQLLSLGIRITQWTNVGMVRDGVTGKLLVYVQAAAEFLKKDMTLPRIQIGPPNWDVSCDRANYVLTQIGYIQEMLNSTFFSGYEWYMDTWVTTFVLPNATTSSNYVELVEGDPWYVDFGGGTYMEASILPISTLKNIVLQQELFITKNNITKTEEDLLEQGFLYYKVFNIDYSGPGLDLSYDFASACAIDDFYWGVDLTLLTVRCDELGVSFSDVGGGVDIDMVVSFNLTLKAHVGLKTKWFKLRKFKTWMQLEGNLSVDFTFNFDGAFAASWEQDIFEWGNESRWYTFWIGPVPVVVRPLLRTTAKLSLDVNGVLEVTWGADASGFVRAGIGWKRHYGRYPIFDTGMDANIREPNWSSNITITVIPSLGFKPILLFYEMVGPSVEIEPYVFIWVRGSDDIYVALGIRLKVGFAFSGWFKEITGLDDWYPATIWDRVLWERPERPDHDVAVAEIRPPEEAYAHEYVTFSVDVVNFGTNPETIDVTLYFIPVPSQGWGWCEFICNEGNPQSLTLSPKSFGTLNFTCLMWFGGGGILTEGTYDIAANATISYDGNDSNNWLLLKPHEYYHFEVHRQDVAIIDLYTNGLVEQQINVTVKNKGTETITALPVFLYYLDAEGSAHLIGNLWSEYMRLEFNLPPGDQSTLTFESDTERDASDYVAVAPILPHEWYKYDNIYPNTVSFACDLARNGEIDIFDIIIIAGVFGADPRDPNWNSDADIVPDGVIDIFDCIKMALSYGESVPVLP